MDKTARIENFERLREKFESEGYSVFPRTISILRANIMALVTALPLALICVFIFMAVHNEISFNLTIAELLLFFPAVIVCIVIHEALHGLTWGLFCADRYKSIHLGVMWKQLTPYCCCSEPLAFGPYILGGLMPLLILGIGMFLIALFTNSLFLLVLSFFNIVAAGGDTTIAFMLLRFPHALIMDHPTDCGFWAFQKVDGEK